MLPEQVQACLEEMVQGIGVKELRAEADQLSRRYRGPRTSGQHLLTQDREAIAYALTRMPATFGAVREALFQSLQCTEVRPTTLLDVGAGTGAASWAADGLLPIARAVCLEREPAMRRMGSRLMQSGSGALKSAGWLEGDVTAGLQGERAELVTCAYVLNELPEASLPAALSHLWDATEQMLLILEPGTPEGWRLTQEIRRILTGMGAHLIAPCVCADCPVPQGDWCHFTARIQRSRLHRLLKDGDSPYEDEKFTYLAFTRAEGQLPVSRVLRHPTVGKGRIGLSLCTEDGMTETTVTKRDPAFRIARKLQAGDAFDPNADDERGQE